MEWLETGKRLPWEEAVDYCQALGGGWRLPTIEELISLVDFSRDNPATEEVGIKSERYWSATVNANYPGGAWYAYFHNGSVNYGSKSYNLYVRAVRGE